MEDFKKFRGGRAEKKKIAEHKVWVYCARGRDEKGRREIQENEENEEKRKRKDKKEKGKREKNKRERGRVGRQAGKQVIGGLVVQPKFSAKERKRREPGEQEKRKKKINIDC